VSVLGALLATHASTEITDGLAAAGIDPAQLGGQAGHVPDVGTLPAPIAAIVEHAYGTGVAEIFLVAAPLGMVALIALAFMREVPLGAKSGIELAREREADAVAA
jgi:hypothetical protein